MSQSLYQKKHHQGISSEYIDESFQKIEENVPLLTLTDQAAELENQLIERDLAIRNVQASLFQVGDIYRELGVLVGSQQTCIGSMVFLWCHR